ncbi:Glycosyltransferase like family protein [Pedobacter sp. ok626]|uniref:glycosyltransferase n=1 Tax=Pedobacter sp. ok626 TaxID=1761882 RepID=UPI0008885B67|nr:glycosyltransferase [Pedobacter sp. ok626]SDK80845.1 Glycosyltransferase like family protein [Pedobacter sp. ok626]
MITIIVSSAKRQFLEHLRRNIEATIGTPYELIAIENSKGEMGICHVYNQGVSRAKYEVLCFMHEDLEIKTNNWGLKVLSAFDNHLDLGVLGVAGCAYKSFAPSGWDADGNEGGVKAINYIQNFKSKTKEGTKVYFNSTGEDIVEVACLDGMWLCTRKAIAVNHRFDDTLLKGFHGYDVDFCLNVGQTHQVAVTFEILMEHFSEGSFSKEWLLEILKVHQKWQHILPISKVALSDVQQLQFEKRAYKRLITNMINFGFKKGEILNILINGKKSGKIPLIQFLKLSFCLLKL